MEIFCKHFDQLTAAELYEILKNRSEVFVVEQNCVYQDLDGKDLEAHHVWCTDGGRMLAYLRVLAPGVSFPEASLGRVITLERGKGYGALIMREGIRALYSLYGRVDVMIEAQSYAEGFYGKQGFVRVSDEFDVDGIPHIKMLLSKDSPRDIISDNSIEHI